MEWTCPHCQTALASPETGGPAPDLRPGWRYGRCFQCSGYAMIESASGKALKVERPPRAQDSRSDGTSVPIALQASATAPAAAPLARVVTPPPFLPSIDIPAPGPAVPPAAPRAPRPGPRVSPLTAGIATTLGTILLALGAGKHLSNRLQAARDARLPEALQAKADAAGARAQAAAARIGAQPHATAASPPLPAAEPAAVPPPSLASLGSGSDFDLIHATSAAIATAPALKNRPAPRLGARPMAREDIQLYAHAREGVKTLELRAGPGAEHRMVGKGSTQYEYPVLEWNGRWFKIGLDDRSARTAWVHYDKIELFSEDEGKEADERP